MTHAAIETERARTGAGERPQSARVFTRRRLTWAGLLAVGSCAAVCSVPLLAVALGGGATATGLASFAGVGSELVVGGVVFLSVLVVLALRARARAGSAAVCGVTCGAGFPSSNGEPAPARASGATGSATDSTVAAPLPVVCDPTLFSRSEREAHVALTKALLLERPTSRRTLDDGLEFHYTGGEELFLSLAGWAAFEHRCCAWAAFTLELHPAPPGGAGTIRLRMTGGGALLHDSLKQLENDGPQIREFLRGGASLTRGPRRAESHRE